MQYRVNIDSFKARQKAKSILWGKWEKDQSTIGNCLNHPRSAWDPKYPTCYMGKVKREPCKRKEEK
jgi:hypothetical protein